jgi:hypothetical protein
MPRRGPCCCPAAAPTPAPARASPGSAAGAEPASTRRRWEALTAAELQPYFGLRWLITWFAHDLPDLGSAARMFDLFVASHPLMPLYVGALVMTSHR